MGRIRKFFGKRVQGIKELFRTDWQKRVEEDELKERLATEKKRRREETTEVTTRRPTTDERRTLVEHLTTAENAEPFLAAEAVRLWDAAVERGEKFSRTPHTIEITELKERTLSLKDPPTKLKMAEFQVIAVQEHTTTSAPEGKRLFITLTPARVATIGDLEIPCDERNGVYISQPFGRKYTEYPLPPKLSRFQGHFVIRFEETPEGRKRKIYFINFGYLSCK